MKKFLLKYRRVILLMFLIMPFVFSCAQVPAANRAIDLNPLGGSGDLWVLLKKFFTLLQTLVIPLAVLMLAYSGYMFVTAMGDTKQVESAKENFKNTIIGIAVLIGARALVDIVQATIENLNK